MPVTVQIITDLGEVGDRLLAADAAFSRADEILKGTLIPILGQTGVDAIKDHTPTVTGALRDSTMFDDDGAGTISFSQPAESLPDQSGNWGGLYYVQWVVGGRGDVYPVNKKALAGPGFGPVGHAGPAAANPYPEEAMTEAQPKFEIVLMAGGIQALRAIVHIMQ